MSKKLIFPFIVLLLIISFIYLFIPGTMRLSVSTHVKCTSNELIRCLHDQQKWQQWFPGNKETFEFEGYQFKEKEKKLNGTDINISNNYYKIHSSLISLSLATDSVLVTWSGEVKNGLNPITRIKHFLDISNLEQKMGIVLDSLRSFASEPINVYGYNIRRTGFDDSLLLSTRNSYKSIPDLNEQYRLIHELQHYIRSQGAVILDSPMVHISRAENATPTNTDYRIQVAVSIDRPILETKSYSLIRMVHINGKYVTADVKGGPDEIQKAREQIEFYMKDHLLTSPGISFEIYLTDRIKQSDSSKWITRIYYPST